MWLYTLYALLTCSRGIKFKINCILTPFIMTKEYAMKEEVYTKTITKVKLRKATNLSYPTIRCWMEKGLLTPKRN